MPESSSFEIYLRQINGVPLLTPERERELARRIIRDNDSSAREEMILANLRLVINVARKFMNRGMSIPDLVAEGNLGLLKAVERFNPEMGTRFSTYATWWIRQTIRRSLFQSGAPLYIPPYMSHLISREKRAAAQLQSHSGGVPTVREISVKMSLSDRQMRIIHQAKLTCQSTAHDHMHDDTVSLSELLADQKSPSPDEAIVQKEQMAFLRRLLRKIDRREAEILRLRFGLDSAEPHTLEEVGATLGLTRERVRQLERQSLRRLNAYLSAKSPFADADSAVSEGNPFEEFQDDAFADDAAMALA